MAVGVAARREDRREALLGDAEEAVRVRGRAHGVDRDLHAAVGAVLEADGHRQARGELAVHLALGRPRADRAPGDQVRGELGRDRVEELAARGQPQLGEVQEQAARQAQALVDREAPVELRVVDEPLPADGGPRLLEVDAHHDVEVARVRVGRRAEPPAVVEGGDGVVDRARADDDEEPVVAAVQDVHDLAPTARDGLRAAVAERQLLEQDRRRDERAETRDPEIARALGHGAESTTRGAGRRAPARERTRSC